MTKSRENLIKDLVADLEPVARPGRIGVALAIWLAIAGVYSVFIILATGPLREGALGNLIAEPAFALESLVAVLTIAALARAVFRLSLPGVGSTASHVLLPLILLASWIAFYAIGLWYPAHPVSTLGQRDYCIWQAVLFSLPSLAFLLWMARRFFPVSPRTTGMLAGAAAAAIPAALMQFACMYVPSHIITHHLGPVLIVAVLGALVGRLALKTRRTVPRSRDVAVH
jgi:hypothetical protein